MENHISENVQQKETGQKIADKVNQVADQARELAESLGRKVTLTELADETGMSLFDLKEAVDLSGDAIEDIDSKGENWAVYRICADGTDTKNGDWDGR